MKDETKNDRRWELGQGGALVRLESAGSLPKCLQQLGLGQGQLKVRNQDLHWSLPVGGRDPVLALLSPTLAGCFISKLHQKLSNGWVIPSTQP